jgi:hypothetical protein
VNPPNWYSIIALVLDAIVFRMRTDCHWNHLPRSFPDDSSVHRTFVRWSEQKILDAIRTDLIEAWRILTGRIGSGRPWMAVGEGPKRETHIGPNPTDQAKNGVQCSVLVEGNGQPVAVELAGANIPDA